MRKTCPICNTEPSDSFQLDFVVPTGWELPNTNYVKLCPACGFIWYDNDRTQRDYDAFYINRYGFGTDMPGDKARLWLLANQVLANYDRGSKILDVGGNSGYFENALKDIGFSNVRTANVGEGYGEDVDIIIMSHVIEHVYGLGEMMNNVCACLNSDGIVIAEVPSATEYTLMSWPYMLDYHQKHVNHFTGFNLDLLFSKYGFSNRSRRIKEYLPLGAPCYQGIYLNNGFETIFDYTKMRVINYTDEIARKICQNIKEPVIIYGLGDVAWHMIASTDIPIAGLVDNDPAYVGCEINGIPVTTKIEGDYPILIMARGQKQSILDQIRSEGHKNRIIDIDELEFKR